MSQTHADPDLHLFLDDTDIVAHTGLTRVVQPMRREGQAWVVHATDQWSQAHLELPKPVAASRLLDHLRERLDVPVPATTYCVAHRWRYAQTQHPLGEPALTCADRRVSLCGDWCLGPTVADACRSGTFLAQAIAADA